MQESSIFYTNGPIYSYQKLPESFELVAVFDNFIKEKFKISKISEIHNLIRENNKLGYKTDQSTLLHKEIYADFDKNNNSILINSYRVLLKKLLNILNQNYSNERWAIQRYPSLRIHFPNNVSVFEFHRDSDYNHSIGEINHFLAITDCHNSSALQIEKNLGWENYFPLNLSAGESAFINTAIFKHGDVLNETDSTRISIDFRFIPINVLENQVLKKSLTASRNFTINDYFMSFEELD